MAGQGLGPIEHRAMDDAIAQGPQQRLWGRQGRAPMAGHRLL